MRHDQWLCDSLHLPQWMVKFHSSYEFTEKDYQDVPAICEQYRIVVPDGYYRF